MSFEVTTLIRRILRKAYVPIYFARFQSAQVDEAVARYYLNDRWATAPPPEKDEAKASRLRTQILVNGFIGVLLYCWVIPMLIALLTSSILRTEDFPYLVALLSLFQGYRIFIHMADWPQNFIPAKLSASYSLAAYSAIVSVAAYVNLWLWDRNDRQAILSGGWSNAFLKSWDTIWSVVIVAVVAGLLATAISAYLVNPSERRRRVKQREETEQAKAKMRALRNEVSSGGGGASAD